MSNKLKPCPFCGCEKINSSKNEYNTKDWFSFYCDNCEIETDEFETEESAINFWNKRSND